MRFAWCSRFLDRSSGSRTFSAGLFLRGEAALKGARLALWAFVSREKSCAGWDVAHGLLPNDTPFLALPTFVAVRVVAVKREDTTIHTLPFPRVALTGLELTV